MAENIDITFLGTGAAIPTKARNHPAVFLTYKEHGLLFDCGEGTQRQFRRAKKNPMKIEHLCITHWHGDHTLGIPGLLQTLAMNGYSGTLQIHGPKGTKKKMRQLRDLFIAENSMTYEIAVQEHEQGIVFETDEIRLTAFALEHTAPSIGYCFEVKEKRRIDKKKLTALKIPGSPLLQKLVQGKDITIAKKKVKASDVTYLEPARRVAYVLDTKYHAAIAKHVKGAELLIIESTFTSEESAEARRHKHMTAAEAGRIATEANAQKLAIIHTSQRYEKEPLVIKKEVTQSFSGLILFPKDLDSVTV